MSPDNGATGVAADAVVTLTFSEPMNTQRRAEHLCLERSAGGRGQLRMVRGDTLLQVTPNQPLSLAAGSSTTTTLARRYAFEIGASALDLDGDALPRLAHCPPCPA